MDWITGIQNAIDYIESHITEPMDYDEIAKRSFSSPFHFQRVFSILCGYTVGEYVRCRRLSLAGAELSTGKAKVIDVAFKYGYDTPESFAKAFRKFHGVTPSQARGEGVKLKSFSPLHVKISLEGGTIMDYQIEHKPEMCLTGFKRHFLGDPNDKNKQDHYFACETRAKQYMLDGLARDFDTTYQVLTNFDPDGYDFYIAAKLPKVNLDDFEEDLGEFANWFEHLHIPEGLYMVCQTERTQWPCDLQDDLRRRAVSQWLPTSGYQLRNAPEISIIHWYWEEGNVALNSSRYCELWLPVERK